jgi:hypothetical protein
MWTHDDPRWAQYAKRDGTLRYMLEKRLPLTRKVWLELNYFGEPPGPHDEWGGEQEDEVPPPFRDETQIRDKARHPGFRSAR